MMELDWDSPLTFFGTVIVPIVALILWLGWRKATPGNQTGMTPTQVQAQIAAAVARAGAGGGAPVPNSVPVPVPPTAVPPTPTSTPATTPTKKKGFRWGWLFFTALTVIGFITWPFLPEAGREKVREFWFPILYQAEDVWNWGDQESVVLRDDRWSNTIKMQVDKDFCLQMVWPNNGAYMIRPSPGVEQTIMIGVPEKLQGEINAVRFRRIEGVVTVMRVQFFDRGGRCR